ncbi:hypothetical protein M433DRAFT_239288 [Acidomyces richmondensis BFW]|nr:MAG: hypothetical protein FE78DRAFT_384578 [Acidomyces sp. 'richmondensis']KYG45761.1 hypothetical protein M433DRAFT_239288 [Acidomyces richmondensis BFW]
MPIRPKVIEQARKERLKDDRKTVRPPENWPKDIKYLTDHTYSAAITTDQRAALSRTTAETLTWVKIPPSQILSPSPLVRISIIEDENHPAHGQRGLFAARHLEPETFICLYLGHVHTNSLSDTDPHSDYDLAFDRELSLSVDAARSGNESRCANDYRGIAERANAEFRDCFVQVSSKKRTGGVKWERRVGIFVLSAGKAGKRKMGIAEGDEILVSYGKGYWEARRTVAGFRKDEVMLKIAQLALEA